MKNVYPKTKGMSKEAAAAYWGLSISTLNRMLAKGAIKYWKVGRRVVVDPDSLCRA